MNVIILAAGESKRLRPLTNDIHKSLITIGKETILDRLINTLRPHKPKNIVIVIGYKGNLIVEHVTNKHKDLSFTFIENKEYETTGASHSLWLAERHITGPTLYINGDVVCYPEIIDSVIKHEKESVTAIKRQPWDEEQVNIVHDENGKIVSIGKHIGEKESHGEFIGITKIGKSFAKKLRGILSSFAKNKEQKRFAVDAINNTIKEGEEKYIVDITHLPAIEIDTLEDLMEAKRLFG